MSAPTFPGTVARLRAACGVAVLAVLLAGCAAAAPPVADFNDADVTFVRTMLQHGQQGAAMADLAAKRATRPEVARLAVDLRAAQAPEASRLTGYLDSWRAGAPETPPTAPGHGDRAQYDPVAELANVTGAQFDTLFLQLMIAHHQSGIAAARREVTDGRNAGAVQLAGAIVTDQGAEIDRMQQLMR